MGALRAAGAALGVIALGAGSGYAAGHFAVPESVRAAVAGPRATPTPEPSPTPSPTPVVKAPKPNNLPGLKVSDLTYRRQAFVLEGNMRSTISLQVPRWWTPSDPSSNEKRFNDGARQRYIRIESANTLVGTPSASAAQRVAALADYPAVNGLKVIRGPQVRTLRNDDGERIQLVTLVYTHIPGEILSYVIGGWVALPGSPYTAVEFSATGLPQDAEALQAILERAAKTVRRTDG